MKFSDLKELCRIMKRTPKGIIKVGLLNTSAYYQNSSCGKKENTIQVVCYHLRILTHVIEKGLSLPKVRKGFGKEKVKTLLELLDKYIEINDNSYDTEAFINALAALQVYVDSAKENECDISFIDMQKYQAYLDASVNCGVCWFDSAKQKEEIKSKSFQEFAESRHSIRGFSDEKVPEQLVKEAVRLAQTAPSACNRQSSRVIHIQDKSLCEKILDVQGGAKGHSVTEVILVAADLDLYHYISEMHVPYVDGGIFVMNLLYALTYYGIGTCPLIWNDYGEKGKKLRELINIPGNLHVVAVVQIGMYPEGECKYAISQRRALDSIYFTEKSFDFSEQK